MDAEKQISCSMRVNFLKDDINVQTDVKEKRHAAINTAVKMTMSTKIFSDDLIRVEIEVSEIPWLKIFTQVERREFSECSLEEKSAIFEALDVIEKEMLSYYRPAKINIASFGNYVPLVHWHIMARFREDSFFPEPMWGTKQREASLQLPSFECFCENVKRQLKENQLKNCHKP